jgi:hypothetical protein
MGDMGEFLEIVPAEVLYHTVRHTTVALYGFVPVMHGTVQQSTAQPDTSYLYCMATILVLVQQ